jgi:hypothetical protein
VYLVAVAGWLGWLRKEKRLALLAFAVFFAAVILNAAMGDWWGSESFGQRRLLGLTPLFALGLAEATAFALRRPLLPVAALAAAAILWNQQLAAVYNAQLAGPRRGAIHLDRLLAAQGEMFDRQLTRWDGRLPRALWVTLYDHLHGVWLDEGPRSLGGRLELGGDEPGDLQPVLADNWAQPEAEGDVAFRRVKGRSARLRLPLRHVSGLTCAVRLRSEADEAPQRLALVANGHATGALDVGPGWGEVRFELPAAWLRRGFNDVELSFATAGSLPRPGRRPRDVAAAVDSITCTRS